MAKKKPDPHPMSDHQARAKSIRYAARCSLGCRQGCLCAYCGAKRGAFVAGWRAYRMAARRGDR